MFNSFFDNDPFFRDSMADMDRMMVGMTGMPSSFRQHNSARQIAQPNNMALSPFGMNGLFGGSMFGGMQSMMMGMQNSMRMMQSNEQLPGSSFHSSYTSVSYGTGDGQPKVYQASSSTKVGPGGVKETQKSERNSATGLQKMAIGHHIGDRSHLIEKSKNNRTGDEEESQEFINLDEDEADSFNEEWKRRIRSAPTMHRSLPNHRRHTPYRRNHEPAAIEYYSPPGNSRRQSSKKRTQD